MRKLLKFAHTMGAIGLTGSLACLLVLAKLAPAPELLAGYGLVRSAMAEIARWLVFPSLALTLIPGLLSLAVNRAFHNAGWAWIKAGTGILIFMGGLHALAPIQEEGRVIAAGALTPDSLSGMSAGEIGTLWAVLLVCVVNVALGVWRPRLSRAARPAEVEPAPTRPWWLRP